MQAIVLTRYSSSAAMEVKSVAKPTPQKNQVLVKVYAAAVNDYDWSLASGKPYLYRLMFGLIKPKIQIPGMELSGVVEGVGHEVNQLKVGDAVYGDISEYGFGAFAEYVCVNEKALIKKPAEMSFEEAASISHAAMLAMQGLIDVGNIQTAQKVLINGAGGGVGTFALQIAKLFNAEVTGVDKASKLDSMKLVGFDHVIDYECDNFVEHGPYDLILDTKTSRSVFDYLRALSSQGKYVTVGGKLTRLLQVLFMQPWVAMLSKKRLNIVALKANKDLKYINELYQNKKIKTLIDGPYELADIPELIQYFGDGKHSGKVIVTIVR